MTKTHLMLPLRENFRLVVLYNPPPQLWVALLIPYPGSGVFAQAPSQAPAPYVLQIDTAQFGSQAVTATANN